MALLVPLAPPAAAGNALILHIVMTLVLFVLCGAVHEAAHAWAALRCGDPTARDLGRLTLNPLPHIDPVMTILVPGLMLWVSNGQMAFGGAKPVPVMFNRLRNPWADMSAVALAGPFSNLLLGLLFMLLWKVMVVTGWYMDAAPTDVLRASQLLPQVLEKAVIFNLVLFVFNLVPIPPLDGSRVMAWALPPGLREPYVALERWGIFIVFGMLLWWPAFKSFLWETVRILMGWLETVVTLGGQW